MNTIHNAIERRNYLQFDILANQRVGLNKVDGKGLTPLMKVNHEPNKKNATEMVRLLLRQSPRLDAIDRRGRNALMHAGLVGNANAAELLLNAGYFDPAMRDHTGNAPIHYGAMSGDVPTLIVLLDHLKKLRIKTDLRNDQGLTPLHMACSQGHLEAARFLQSEGECSLTVRDGVANKTAREWLEQACDIPEYLDPFGRNADISSITLKKAKLEEEFIDTSQVRIFLFMKEKPDIDSDEDSVPSELRPPWDISTNVEAPPKYLKNGFLIPARVRPGSATSCRHFRGPITLRPFSAPCGYSDYSTWKHPMDVQPYLTVSEMRNFRRYSSATDVRNVERNPVVREKASRLLFSAQNSKRYIHCKTSKNLDIF